MLCSGPMVQLYNTILRRFPVKEFGQFRDGGNLFSTTIFVLVSSIVKIARVGENSRMEIFSCISSLECLPDSFRISDVNGVRGYTEYGILNATSKDDSIEVMIFY